MKKLVFLAMLVFGALTAQAGTLIVDGTGSVAAKPDQTVITFALEVRDKVAKTAMTALGDQSTTLIAELQDKLQDMDAIATQNLSLYPNYDYRDEPKFIDYKAATTLVVTLDQNDLIGSIVDILINSGVGTVQSVQFVNSDPAPLEKEARRLAILDAMQKARDIAEWSGVTLGAITKISEGGATQAPVPMMRAVAAFDSASVAVGSQDISTHVSIEYAIND